MSKKAAKNVLRRPGERKTNTGADEAKNIILGILYDFITDEDRGAAASYFQQVGFDLLAVARNEDLPKAWLAHYRLRPGVYDLDRACEDFARWPPIAARIAELKAVRGPTLG